MGVLSEGKHMVILAEKKEEGPDKKSRNQRLGES